MDKFNFFKKYIKSYAVQIILLLNYSFLVGVVQGVGNISKAPMEICSSGWSYEDIVLFHFSWVWLTILMSNAFNLFIFYNLEKFLRKKLGIIERDEPTKIQYFCFFIGLFALIGNILSAPILVILVGIRDIVAFMLFP